MISCLRQWLPLAGDSNDWPDLHLDAAPLNREKATRWYATGRAALFQALRPLAEQSPGTALIPAYIAGGVIDPLRALGFTIRFYCTGVDLLCDLDQLGGMVESDPQVRVVVILHPMGRIQDLASLPETCRSHGAVLIEDCAQALFCVDEQGRPAGSQGDLALFSLTKHLGCVDGAAVVFRSERLQPPPQPRRRPLLTRLATGWYGLHLLLDQTMHRCSNISGAKGLLVASGYCYDRFYARASRDFSPLAPSPTSARQLNGLNVRRLVAQRRRNVATIYSGLHSPYLRLVYPVDHPGWVPMAVPAMVEGVSRQEWVGRIMDRGVFLASLCSRWDHLPPGDEFSREREYLDHHVLIPINEFINDEQMSRIVDVLNSIC
jgi:dTDP-4-amino-4,6-dideoxygalactose transaminase